MSHVHGSSPAAFPVDRLAAGAAATSALAVTVALGAVLLALLALYAVFFDQGALLSPALGKIAYSANYLHELAHDGRHLLGAPCH